MREVLSQVHGQVRVGCREGKETGTGISDADPSFEGFGCPRAARGRLGGNTFFFQGMGRPERACGQNGRASGKERLMEQETLVREETGLAELN